MESCVGAPLLNRSMGGDMAVTCRRKRNLEVDCVLHRGKTNVGIEVKSGRRKERRAGMQAFAKQFKPKRKLLCGGQAITRVEFLMQPVEYWLQ